MRVPLAKAAVYVFGALAAALVAGARAESFGPIGKSMHHMQGALWCLQGRDISGSCGTDAKELGEFRQAAKAAAAAVSSRYEGKPRLQAKVAALFERLEAALDRVGEALKKNDAAAKEAALKDVVAVMKEGHTAFQRHL